MPGVALDAAEVIVAAGVLQGSRKYSTAAARPSLSSARGRQSRMPFAVVKGGFSLSRVVGTAPRSRIDQDRQPELITHPKFGLVGSG